MIALGGHLASSIFFGMIYDSHELLIERRH